MNSAQKHFTLTIATVFIGIAISVVCGLAISDEEAGLLHIAGLWFGGFVIAAAIMDYMSSLSDAQQEGGEA